MSLELEDVREKKNSVGLYVVIGLLLVGMAGFGTSQFGTGSGGSDPVAMKLGNAEIASSTFTSSLNANRKSYPDFSNAEIEELTLTRLRQDLSLSHYIEKYPLAASNETIDEVISNNPSFHENGQFSEEVFRRFIRVEPHSYRNAISKDIAKQEFMRTLASTSVVSQAEIKPFQEMQNLSRDILVAKIARADFSNTADDAEIKAFYEAHKDQYMTEEKINVEYVELNPESIIEDTAVTDAEMLLSSQPARSANYYLFTDEVTANLAIDRVNQGKAINDVIKEFGDKVDDSGELDNLSPIADETSLIPQEAMNAIFALTDKGQLTAPISVDGSFYVFALSSEPKTEVTEAEKESAKRQVQQTKSTPIIAELTEKLDKVFHSNQTPDLVNISEETGLQVKQSGLLAINSNQDILAVPELVEAINDSNKATGELQEPVTVGERVIIYRLTEVKAAEQKPLSDIKSEVEEATISEKTDKQLKDASDSLIEQTKTEGLAAAVTAKNYPSQAYNNFDGKVAEDGVLDPIGALFVMQQTPKIGKDNAQQITSMTGDVYVYVNTDVRLGEAAGIGKESAKKIESTLSNGLGQMELSAFLQSISSNADIEMRSGLLQSEKTQ